MKVLWLTYDLPYPLVSGGKLRAYHLIKGLSKNHEIDLFSFIRSKDQLQHLPELKKYCQRIETFKRPYVWSPRNILLSGFSPLPFAAVTYYFQSVKRKLVKMIREENYDLVHFESFYPAVYLLFVRSLGLKTLFATENVEYQVYERYAAQRKFLPLKPLLSLDVWKMRRFEKNLWKQSSQNVALSKNDATTIKQDTGKDCPVIPNGVDVGFYSAVRTGQNNQPTIMFVGNLVYVGNSESVKFFLREIFPIIVREIPSVRFLLISATEPRWFANLSEGLPIELIRDTKNPMTKYFSRSDVFVAPITVASGTNIKVLEAMAAGLPVVSTKFGAEGHDVQDNRDILIADDPQEFAEKISTLLKNPTLRDKIGIAGKALVQQKYDWKFAVEKLNEVYNSL